MTPDEVRRCLDNGLAYTTIMTILTRLWQKGQVDRHREGRAFAYHPVMSEAELRARNMTDVLDRSSDREAVLARFVDTLSAEEVEALRHVLASLDGT
jgi:predicted transcriptional regulator